MKNYWNYTEYSSKKGKRKRRKRKNAISDPIVTNSQIIYKE